MNLTNSDYQLIVAVFGLIIPIITGSKVFKAIFRSSKNKLRLDYEFANKIFGDNKWKELSHDYLIEQGYLGLSGKRMDAALIRFFMTKSFPLDQLTDYGIGKRFLTVKRDGSEVTAIEFIKRLNCSDRRIKIFGYVLMLPYFLFAMITLTPFLFLAHFINMGIAGLWLSILIITILACSHSFLLILSGLYMLPRES
ncbi:hypothetical protein [Desulfovibrio sp. JC010]|uniref:hypothetical protein n=1 Tax=Desulfovibrio sp. JC010 TaxID=2593641 RepID=UPI0013D41E35|nr:hypothetical protein [Desulfovibrio sp. JC010]NDV25959.1 hypothetical protein [Desulfovibrio sp. JC010]